MSLRVTLPLLQLQETLVQRQTGNHSDQSSQLASGRMHSGFFAAVSSLPSARIVSLPKHSCDGYETHSKRRVRQSSKLECVSSLNL